jgi:ubiquinone/menaquinone biosynthesis C-methylase UbiE
MKSRSVFEEYAHEYDLITNAKAREKHHAKEVQALLQKFKPESVLDAGCASGLTAALFAQQGITAVGLDRSRRMIAVSKKKYGGAKLPVSFRYGSFEALPKTMTGRFDLVVCLANSISGVGTIANLRKSIRNFYRVLRPGGTLVLQALNYASMKDGDIMPIRATQQGKIGYLRYARRRGSGLEISVVRLDFSTRPFRFEPFVHEFDNFAPAQLIEAMKKAAPAKIVRYGDLLLSSPFRKSSRDIILTGTKLDG